LREPIDQDDQPHKGAERAKDVLPDDLVARERLIRELARGVMLLHPLWPLIDFPAALLRMRGPLLFTTRIDVALPLFVARVIARVADEPVEEEPPADRDQKERDEKFLFFPNGGDAGLGKHEWGVTGMQRRPVEKLRLGEPKPQTRQVRAAQ
jgi:hypothetical protein